MVETDIEISVQGLTKGYSMNKKYIGIVLIILGVAAAYWGFDVYSSAGSKFSRALNGDAPLEAWAAMAGGAIAVVTGIFQVK